MRLCFGTFTTILNHCRSNTIFQASFIAKIINIIDHRSRYTGIKMNGDGPTITKLLSCKINFVFSQNIAQLPSQKDISEAFSKDIAPFVDENQKAKIIISLLEIILLDEYIDFEGISGFKKFFGMSKHELLQQTEFVFSDFLSQVLLYTTYGNIENSVGKQYIKSITKDYIDNLAKPYMHEYRWNESTQTLTLSFLEIFQKFEKAITDYRIADFIEKVDPTNYMDASWIDYCSAFIKDTEKNIWVPYTSNNSDPIGFTLSEIQNFVQTLNEYLDYMGYRMRPIVEHPDTLVPLYRDENAKWASDFRKETIDYRQQLIDIYQKIYYHMLFSHSSKTTFSQ